ncbi:MAG: hypothetical protein GY842_03375 [bacterium]|nr:hypothetical protein [bacterium]
MRYTLVSVIAVCGLCSGAWGGENLQTELQTDVVLRALVDELERSRTDLRLEGLAEPYFLEYGLIDVARAAVGADLGMVSQRYTARSRNLRSEVRVGSHVLDNTNFRGGGWGSSYGGRGGASVPLEDDYGAIRQAIWWATDRQYKDVVEAFEKKKAFMESKMIADKPDDFSTEAPAVYFEERIAPAIEAAPLEKLAVKLSELFRAFPEIQNSHVQIQQLCGNKYLVNTEGTRLRTSGTRVSVQVSATVQADDGMKLSDSVELHAKSLDELPSVDELSKRCRDMVKRLLEVRTAATLESYTGPVLFEAGPATRLFASRFAGNFAGGQRPVGSRTSPNDFEKKIDRRVLPRSVTVIDDPTLESVAGTTVLGHYAYDDQGVKSRPVTLVEGGRLKSLVMSRNPSKLCKSSTGHGRGAYRPSASVGCLILSSSDGADRAALVQEMLEACADEGLEYGIRIAALGRIGGGGGSGGYGGYSRGGGMVPLEMYKVYPDGREELVRGMELGSIDLKAFKRILALGDTTHVRNTASWSGSRTVCGPAMVFEEVDLAKADRDFDKPPILPSPLARADAK